MLNLGCTNFIIKIYKIKIGGRTINNLRYADDTTILAEEKDDMEKLLKKLKEDSEKAGLSLNLKKTKIMTTNRNIK